MKITIETIAHSAQRYPTVGDWFFDEAGNLHITVSQLSDWKREALVAVHELVEVLICKQEGITQEMVDAFDIKYEENRKPEDLDEPGDNPAAPYAGPHCIATGVERILAAALDVSWKKYEDELEALP